jgi:ABC-type phosphate transport system substrate-binding protein
MRNIVILAALFGLLIGAADTQAQGYQVVVNEANGAASISKAQLSKIFLKQTSVWPEGGDAVAVDQSDGSAIRDAFSRAVHGRSASAIAAHWQQQIFSGKDVPPEQKSSDQDVLAFVRANAGAVGYVAAGTPLGTGVKTLTVN